MSKPTPGPWVAGGPTAMPNWVRTVNGDPIAAVSGLCSEDDHSPTESDIANARLIAAAPDLYEALKAAERLLAAISALAASYPRPSNDAHSRILLDLIELPKHGAFAARAAIAKAEQA